MLKKAFFDKYYLKLLLITVSIIILFASFFVLSFFINGDGVPISSDVFFCNTSSPVTVIIDAGHGGIDSGTVSKSGIYEKDINLSISNSIGKIFENEGYNVIYTRKEDEMLVSEKSIKSRKKSDLMRRIEIAEEERNAIFISIHQNALYDTRYSGLQVFYSPNDPLSKAIALSVQSGVREKMMPENHREIKKAGTNIFILDRLKIPAVLIECGFLSNEKEAELLLSESYREKLSYVIAYSVIRSITSEK